MGKARIARVIVGRNTDALCDGRGVVRNQGIVVLCQHFGCLRKLHHICSGADCDPGIRKGGAQDM